MTDITDMWSNRDTARTPTTDLVGFDVEASDGGIGKSLLRGHWRPGPERP